MKTLILVSMFASVAVAADAQSAVKVRLVDGRPINVAIDGRYFNKRGTSVTVGDLPGGYHSIRIFSMRTSRSGRGYEEKIYEGRVTTHNGSITFFTLDAYNGEVYMKEEDMQSDGYAGGGQQMQYGYSGTYKDGRYRDEDDNSRRDNNPGSTPDRYDDNRTGSSNDNTRTPAASQPGSPAASPVATDEIGTLTDDRADELRTKANGKKSDTEKMKLLKDELRNEKILVNQVAAMMDWFNFESSKLDFAKWAYDHTVDKENFSALGDKLTTKNYQDEFNDFIKR